MSTSKNTGQRKLPALSITALSAIKSEGNSGITPFTFLVTRTGDSTGVSSARWTVSAVPRLLNSAKTSDFSGGRFPTGSVAFAAGETSKTVTVGVLGDITAEANEPFRITLSAPSKGTILGTAATATGTILNDDKPPPALSITALSADKREGNSGTTSFTFRVTRTGDLTGVSTAAWSVSGVGSAPTNAGDFSRVVIPSGRVTFAAGQTSQTITVNVAGEAAHERDETFRVTLSGASAGTTLAKAFATGTIRNDDAARPASFAIAPLDAVQPEGLKGSTRPFTFLLTRNGISTGTSSVRWGVNGAGSPSAGNDDFVPSRTGGLPFGTVTFGANDTVKVITVDVLGDRLQEENENFVVQLSNQVGASVSTVSAFGRILDDDYVGDSAVNTLTGTELPEYFDGAGNADRITGGGGPDVFGFRFSYTPPGNTPDQSTPTNPDTITDFAFGLDKISLVDFSNPAFNPSPPLPSSLSRAADSAAATLADLAAAVFDFNSGNQALPARGAALVVATNPAIAGVYIFVNNDTAGLSNRDDLLIKLGGYSGSLPPLGPLTPGSLFV